MANKRFRFLGLVTLVLILASGLTLIGCGDSCPNDGCFVSNTGAGNTCGRSGCAAHNYMVNFGPGSPTVPPACNC